jgi:hypothetical protein
VEESGMNATGRTAPARDFRQRYGDAIADIVELHSANRASGATGPATHGVKAALRAIAVDPDGADRAGIDPLTHALLMDPAWRRLRVRSLHGLTRGQLAECAQYALDHFPPPGGPFVDRAEVRLALALLAAARGWHAPRRTRLVREALSTVFEAGHARATAVLRTAHRELHAGS